MTISIPNGYILDEYAKKAWDAIESGTQVVYIAGKAGVGKSTLVQYIIENTHKEYAIVAPTGIAALNVGGSTIHKMFKFPARIIEPKKDVHYHRDSILKNLQLLIIDEISMVRVDVMEAIDYAFRVQTGRDVPFGGCQIVLVGDCFQLPPVVGKEEERVFYQKYESPWWFDAKCFENIDITFVELKTIYRQTQKGFLKGLHNIRMKEDVEKTVDAFNQKCYMRPDHNHSIILAAYKNTVETINKERLDIIEAQRYTFKAAVTGEFSLNENNLPAPLVLELKEGARVMITKNIGEGIVNGSMGTVEKIVSKKDIGMEYIAVKLDTGISAIIERESWKNYEYVFNKITRHIEATSKGSYTQFPITLGWAITIHKSQGLTLENVDIDFGRGAFTSGQAYVAISRCKTLNGLTFRKPMRYSDIIVDPEVIDFYKLNFDQQLEESEGDANDAD